MMSANASSSARSSTSSNAEMAGDKQKQPGFSLAAPSAPFSNKAGRPASEIFFANAQHPLPKAKHIDQWFESLSQFEDMLEDMAKVSLDPVFKDELNAIDQWFSVLSEPERTSALYSLMQHCSDLQVRFFITILQQMLKMDTDPEAEAEATAEGAERHSIAVQGAYAKQLAQPQLSHPGTGVRMSYDSAGARGGLGMLGGAPAPGFGEPKRTSGFGDVRRVSGFADQKPKSSSQEAAEASWRMSRGGGSPPGDIGSIGAVGSRRGSGALGQQQTPRASVDMEPKDFRWSSLTEAMEPFDGIGSESGSSALSHMLEANMNRTSGIAARRSVSNRLSIAVKSPRDTMQMQGAHQQQQLAATLAQMSLGGAYQPQQQQQQQQPHAQPQHQPRAPYVPSGLMGSPQLLPHQGQGYGSRMLPPGYHSNAASASNSAATTPVRAAFPRNVSNGPQSPAGIKPQPDAPIDLSLVRDIPAWLRSLRLHKYTDCFADMDWTDVVALNDEQLQAKGVAALGARRKMLKVFEAVALELGKNGQV
ncbi:Flap-structured DNA-binding and RNA-binding protein [Coemansia sp. RSA 1722]|nr:Flap-structured DNA-binding and RNA-binding protein [Coemansia sp. RSA 1722]